MTGLSLVRVVTTTPSILATRHKQVKHYFKLSINKVQARTLDKESTVRVNLTAPRPLCIMRLGASGAPSRKAKRTIRSLPQFTGG